MIYPLFISCPKGLEYLLEEEVRSLGLEVTRVSPQGVFGKADLELLYTLCLWSRIASRVQLILFSGPARNKQDIYQLCHNFAWDEVFSSEKSLKIAFHGEAADVRNSMFGALLIKDAIVDYFRKKQLDRPSIDREQPDILINAHLKNELLTVSLDLCGYGLHQRGYRSEGGTAPLKENIAAALLMRAQWPKLAAENYALHDAFCGSGTIVIEAALMAANIAPGLIRDDQSIVHWLKHDQNLWQKVRDDAEQQIKKISLSISGSDEDPKQISLAKNNAERAGLSKYVNFSIQDLTECKPRSTKGLFISNPPYGERISDVESLKDLYHDIGYLLIERYQGWNAAILTSEHDLARAIGLRSNKQYAIFNGPLACKLYLFPAETIKFMKQKKA